MGQSEIPAISAPIIEMNEAPEEGRPISSEECNEESSESLQRTNED